jgi:hypothetical protein
MTTEEANTILAQARKGETHVGNCSISYDRSTRQYSILPPHGKQPLSYTARQAREFLTTTL